MANHTTSAERYNKRLNDIFESAKQIKEKENIIKTYRGLMSEGYSKETAKYIIDERKKKK